MNMDKHTPAPWRISGAPPTKSRGIDILGSYARRVAHVPLHLDIQPEEIAIDHANARLIAASPTLLAVLTRLVDAYGGEDLVRESPLLQDARAAIAAATGAKP